MADEEEVPEIHALREEETEETERLAPDLAKKMPLRLLGISEESVHLPIQMVLPDRLSVTFHRGRGAEPSRIEYTEWFPKEHAGVAKRGAELSMATLLPSDHKGGFVVGPVEDGDSLRVTLRFESADPEDEMALLAPILGELACQTAVAAHSWPFVIALMRALQQQFEARSTDGRLLYRLYRVEDYEAERKEGA